VMTNKANEGADAIRTPTATVRSSWVITMHLFFWVGA
jgi:hypothetical protein